VNESIARGLVTVLQIYLGLGVVFALPFLLRGIERIDPAARGTGWGFRLIVLPGAVALWPWLLARWLRGQPPPTERNAHRRAAERGR